MAGRIDQRLKDLGIELPKAAAPAGSYVPFVITGSLVVVSGQLPLWNGEMRYRGPIGAGLTIEDGYAAAKLCALNLIAQVREACTGDLDRVVRVVRLGGFVASAAGFTQQPAVLNGASELMVEVFGEAGRHARAAVGAPILPLDAAVEVEGLFALA